MKSSLLETDRLYIKIPKITSLDNWYNLQCDHQVIKYIGNSKSLSKLQIKKNLYKNIEYFKKYNYSFFDINLKSNNNFIGIAGLFNLEFNEKNKNIEIGYIFNKNSWGHGFATECMKLLIDYGLNKIKLKNIYACCHKDNKASKNVIKKCEMNYVKKYKYKGIIDCNLYII